jgi:4'-phosphopantetheinyl transferase
MSAETASPEWTTSPRDPAGPRLGDPALAGGLRAGEVHVWRAAAAAADPRVWEAPLAPAEQDAAARFAFDRDRRTYRVAHGLLRAVLSGYLDEDPAGIVLVAGTAGKPELAGGSGLRFNLTHSAGAAIVALAWERRIGVDLESTQAAGDLAPAMRSTLAPDELALIAATPELQRTVAFLQTWTRKEALLKAAGVGLNHNPRDYPVGDPVATPSTGTHAVVAFGTHWTIADLTVGPAWRGAVAVEGDARPLRLFCLGWSGPTGR